MTESDGGARDTDMEELYDVLEIPEEQRSDEKRWIVLYPDDYSNIVLDADDNVAVEVDIDQAGEVFRLATEIIASLSHQDADGDDVIQTLIDKLEDENR